MLLDTEVIVSVGIFTLLSCIGTLCLCIGHFEGALMSGSLLVIVALFIVIKGCMQKRMHVNPTTVQYLPEISINSVCSICLENFAISEVVHLLSCRHAYHVLCLKDWLLVGRGCPHCRRAVYPISD